jgi:hypothetical protein
MGPSRLSSTCRGMSLIPGLSGSIAGRPLPAGRPRSTRKQGLAAGAAKRLRPSGDDRCRLLPGPRFCPESARKARATMGFAEASLQAAGRINPSMRTTEEGIGLLQLKRRGFRSHDPGWHHRPGVIIQE